MSEGCWGVGLRRGRKKGVEEIEEAVVKSGKGREWEVDWIVYD